ELRVRATLLVAQLLDQMVDPPPIRRRQGEADLRHRVDRHVGVAPLPERVGQRLHVLEDGPVQLLRERGLEYLHHGAQPAPGPARRRPPPGRAPRREAGARARGRARSALRSPPPARSRAAGSLARALRRRARRPPSAAATWRSRLRPPRARWAASGAPRTC